MEDEQIQDVNDDESKMAQEDQKTEEEKSKQNNTMALIGFILGIVSAFVYAIFSIVPIVGIIFSGIGIGTFNPETQKNKWMAWWGLALSIIYFIMSVISHSTYQ